MALALQLFFPVFDNGKANFATLALTNTSAFDAEFTISLNSPDGQETNLVRMPVGVGQQRTLGLETLRRTSETPLEGWISVDASADSFKAYLVSGTLDALSATEPASRPAVTSYLPHIRVRSDFAETGQTDTEIAIVNPSRQTAIAAIRLSSYDRSIAHTAVVSIPAMGSRILRASELLGVGTAQFEGRATVQSYTPVVVWQKIETPVSWSVLRAKGEADLPRDTSFAAPHFVFGGNYQSSLTLWNPTEPAVTLEATAFDQHGRQLGESVRLTLEPGQALSSAVDRLFLIPVIAAVPPPVITGSIKLREINNRPFRVIANVETRSFDSSDKALMLHWLDSSPAHVWEIPFVAQNERFYTGYSVLASRDSTSPTDVTIEVYDLNGVVVQRLERSVAPGALESGLISPPVPGAYIRIWATHPISVIGSVGTVNGSLFEAVVPAR
jgi:hypothetical protein